MAAESAVKAISVIPLLFHNKRLFLLAVINFMVNFVQMGLQDVVLYWAEWKFDWCNPET